MRFLLSPSLPLIVSLPLLLLIGLRLASRQACGIDPMVVSMTTSRVASGAIGFGAASGVASGITTEVASGAALRVASRDTTRIASKASGKDVN